MSETPTAREGVTQHATDIAVRLWADHKDCPRTYDGIGSCGLGYISIDDVQEIIDLATPIVVAAELRRIADRHVTAVFTPDTEWEAAEMHATEKVVAELRARADELDPLDPPARQEN